MFDDAGGKAQSVDVFDQNISLSYTTDQTFTSSLHVKQMKKLLYKTPWAVVSKHSWDSNK